MKMLYVVFATLLVTACSGGGGDSAQTPGPNPNPPDPGSRSLLLPPGSEDAFVAHMRAGLEQWAGLSDDSEEVRATLGNRPGGPTMLTTQAAETIVAADAAGSPAFSETNVLVDGVDEIDRVRYDGANIYVANGDRIQVIDTTTPPGEIVATERVTTDYAHSHGLYHYKYGAESILANIRDEAGNLYLWYDNFFAPWGWNQKTAIDFIDVSSGANVTEQLVIDGNYVNSRRIGGTLYLITRHTPSIEGVIPFADTDAEKATNRALLDGLDVDDVLPRVRFSDGTEAPLVTTSECFVPDMTGDESIYYPTITTITAIDMTSPSSFSSLCLSEGVYGVHVSQNAVYLAAYQSSFVADRYFDRTVIHKFDITGSAPGYAGSGYVPGSFWGDPAFLMGEHDGRVTTITSTFDTGTPVHRLTILQEAGDFKMEVVGQIPNGTRTAAIGKPGEQIYASRIVGDRAFIVTFRQIDPVYVVDLTDSADPFIAGELEIPGFSSYLHPVTDELLLGIGKDTVVEDGITWFQGLNVRLFDVADPGNMRVLADIKIGRRGTDSEVLWDAHAFTILDTGNTSRVAIPVRVAGAHVDSPSSDAWHYYPWTESALYLFEVDESARNLIQAGKVIAENHGTGERYHTGCCSWNDRSFIHGDTVLFLHKTRLFTGDWNSPDETVNLFIPTVFVNPEEEVSTTEMRDGLRVHLLDSVTGDGIACGVARAIDGDFEAELRTGCPDDGGKGLFERAGTYAVEATADGYADSRGEDIRVQEDQFHVALTRVYIYLSPE